MDTDVKELTPGLSERPDQNNKRGEDLLVSDNPKKFWMMLEADGKVDIIFERVQNLLLSLKQKIKDGSATHEEYFKAMLLVNQADLSTTATVQSDDEDGLQENAPHLHATQEDPYPEESTVLTPDKTEIPVSLSELSSEEECTSKTLPVRTPFEEHRVCTVSCFSKRSPYSFKGQNSLKIPVLCNFERRHAKTTDHSKLQDVFYKAPCGRCLRNFEEVQTYLFQTKCRSLFVNYFSFNTYVQLDRTPPNREALTQESDISNGAESLPVSFCNEIDCTKLPYFTYKKAPWPPAYYFDNYSSRFQDSCSCTDGCRDVSKCACLQLTTKASGYISPRSRNKKSPGYCYKRLHRSVPTGIFECSLSCKCDHFTCQNRVVQHGLQVRLQVFKTEYKGWGVRCLDDVDLGTFVCTFAGQTLSRNVNTEARSEDLAEGASMEDHEEAVHESLAEFPKKTQIEASSSDSEIELIQDVEEGTDGSLEKPSQPVYDAIQQTIIQKYGYNIRGMRYPMVRRPKTKTAMLQSRRKLLKRAVAIKNSSSGEDSPPRKQSSKAKLNKNTTKQKSSNSEEQVTHVEQEERLSKSLIPGTPPRKEKKLSLQWRERENCDRTVVELVNRTVIKHSAHEPHGSLVDAANEQKQRTFIGEEHFASSAQVLASSRGSLDSSVDGQTIFLLDATQQGNVGRFLNHSCCPNLFVQNVFVDTHDRNHPWVAFFTNRLVKAGTELTWDYNYEVGSLPENEIPCLCGVSKCRKRII